MRCILFFIFLLREYFVNVPTAQTARPILALNDSNDVFPRKEETFWGLNREIKSFGVIKPQKPPKSERGRELSSQM